MTVRMQRGLVSVRSWNALVKIGTRVTFRGREYLTWGPAGLGLHDVPVVWLDGIEEPIPLHLLDVPGCKIVFGKRQGKDGS